MQAGDRVIGLFGLYRGTYGTVVATASTFMRAGLCRVRWDEIDGVDALSLDTLMRSASAGIVAGQVHTWQPEIRLLTAHERSEEVSRAARLGMQDRLAGR